MLNSERLTSADSSLGLLAALEVAVRYSDKRHAFGRSIRKFQAVQFIVADAITKLDAASHDAEAEKCYTDSDMWKVHEA
jgi:alkylation response protein AidB-like acyl-CoA dehydrogenase